MPASLKLKDFYLALGMFAISITVSLGLALYFRLIINNWLREQLEKDTTSITRILNNELNNYKLNYYGIGSLTSEVFKYNPEELSSGNIADAFGRTENIAFVTNTNGQQSVTTLTNKENSENFYSEFDQITESKDFSNALKYAFNTNSPSFFPTTNSDSKNYIIAIVPVDKSTESYYYVQISFEDLLLAAIKSDSFDSNSRIWLSISNKNKVLYTSSNNVSNQIANRRRSTDSVIEDKITLTNTDLTLNYSEIREANLNSVIRQLPFFIAIVGTILSLLAFTTVAGITVSIKTQAPRE